MCATPDAPDPENPEAFSGSIDPADLQNFEPKVYNMFFWGIYPESAPSDYTLTEQECLEVIANMNREFNRFNIYIKYRGFGILNSDNLYFIDHSCSTSQGGPDSDGDGEVSELYGSDPDTDLQAFAQQPGNFTENMINTYIMYDSCGFSGAYLGGRNICVRSEKFNNWHTVHELGHYFGLNHTHVSYTSSNFCEHVTRDPNDIDDPNDPNDTFFNADIRGDRIVDTEAMPVFNRNHTGPNGQVYNNDVDPTTCDYIGDGEDCQQTDYDIEPAGVRNIMGNGSECPDQSLLIDDEGFTVGQGIYMQETVDMASGDKYTGAETEIAALYEPYKGEYFVAGPIPAQEPLFQPGFEYRFIECSCDCDSPAPYDPVNFEYSLNTVLLNIDKYETDFSLITHPNHSAIIIGQLQGYDQYSLPRRCYDNDNKAASGGSIMKFNDGVFNTNITLTPKDSLGINNPNLIQSLEPGLYKIEKVYQDGVSKETLVQKSGNNN